MAERRRPRAGGAPNTAAAAPAIAEVVDAANGRPVDALDTAPASPEWFDFARAAVVRFARLESGEPVDGDERAGLDRHLDVARARLHDALGEASSFATIAYNAGLDTVSTEVLAVAVACDVDRRLRRLIAQAQGQREPALTLDAISRMLDDSATLALAPDGLLRRAALVELLADLAWSDQRIAVHGAVVWALLGDLGRDPDLPGICGTSRRRRRARPT